MKYEFSSIETDMHHYDWERQYGYVEVILVEKESAPSETEVLPVEKERPSTEVVSAENVNTLFSNRNCGPAEIMTVEKENASTEAETVPIRERMCLQRLCENKGRWNCVDFKEIITSASNAAGVNMHVVRGIGGSDDSSNRPPRHLLCLSASAKVLPSSQSSEPSRSVTNLQLLPRYSRSAGKYAVVKVTQAQCKPACLLIGWF